MRSDRTRIPCLAAAAMAAALAAQAQVTVRMEMILPRDTDPEIDSALTAHRAALATGVVRRNKLFLFLHGGGGSANSASLITTAAAEQGFHAVAITYPMNVLPSSFCTGGNGTCQQNFRREILEGVNHSPHIAIARPDGVENRLIKLLRHLETRHPGENWTRFESAGVPVWSRITVYGHSMGAANAALLAKLHSLERVCLSAPATDISLWWSNPATPAARIIGFSHARDPMYAGQQSGWTAMGLDPFGPLTDVATSTPPYGFTHRLLASAAPATPPPGRQPDYHNSVTMDGATPLDASRNPVYKPAWIHMMRGSLAAGAKMSAGPLQPRSGSALRGSGSAIPGDNARDAAGRKARPLPWSPASIRFLP